MRTVIVALIILSTITAAVPQTLVGVCSPGQAWGTKVNSDFSVNLYCFTPPSGCTPTGMDFSVACNSQYIGAI